jgi:ubiquitin-conjugating enzyme E2 variant
MVKSVRLLVIASAVVVRSTQAFTNQGSSHLSNIKRRANLALNVASVSDETASTVVTNTEEPPKPKSYLDDGFIFGLEGSGLERPRGKSAQVVVEGDNLETQTWQIAAVSATFLGHAAFFASSYNAILDLNSGDAALASVESFAVALSAWVLADLGSGVLHWSVDNYGNGRTPVLGGIIAAFQGHHSAPWTITQRGFCNNVSKLCIPFGIVPMAFINVLSGPFVTMFFSIFCAMEILSQEFHKWSHMTKSECPAWVNALQDAGLTLGRIPHARHHMAPYSGNYCIISGIHNEWLDNSGFFRRLEHMVYNINGIESNSWKLDPQLREKTLRGEYAIESKK